MVNSSMNARFTSVSGYPQDTAEKFTAEMGYEDKLMVCGELFHFLAIEGDKALADKLPFSKIGLGVVIESDISAYQTRCQSIERQKGPTPLWEHKPQWMDFNAGALLDGKTMGDLNEGLVSLVIEVASGKKVKAETLGFWEIAIWKGGVTL